MLVHQKTEKNRLKCNQCNKFTCGRMSELRRHIKTKHGENENDDVNDNVGITSKNKKSCEKIQCDQCPYASTSRQHLARHMELVHAQ